jgi:hypothetical protein|tara:strand:- start:437 stop:760 length:324 start_codon:yes stop_codon:yes gene_type:complete
MQVITLEIADNGIIKTIVDDNINGAGERFESKMVFDLERHDSIENKIELLYTLAEDMGVNLGNSKQSTQIKIVNEWGDNYVPTKKEAEEAITQLKAEITRIEGLRKP